MHTDPLAFFITWTCYGTWMPGDERGWTRWHKGENLSQPLLVDWCREQMTEQAIFLDQRQRELVNATIVTHCYDHRCMAPGSRTHRDPAP